MKRPEEDWQREPMFDGPLPRHGEPAFEDPDFEEAPQENDPPEFAAIRRIEILSRMHHMAFRNLFRGDGLPPAQAGALKVVIRYPGMSQRELADRLHIQRATATVMLQKMEKAGYISRENDQADQRISRIYPTTAARAMDTENQKRVDAYFARCFSGVSQKDFSTMETVLGRLGENLREMLSENPDPMDKE